MTDRILPVYRTVGYSELREALYQALGAASVCWDENKVFMSERADQIGKELLSIIEDYSHERYLDGVYDGEQFSGQDY